MHLLKYSSAKIQSRLVGVCFFLCGDASRCTRSLFWASPVPLQVRLYRWLHCSIFSSLRVVKQKKKELLTIPADFMKRLAGTVYDTVGSSPATVPGTYPGTV